MLLVLGWLADWLALSWLVVVANKAGVRANSLASDKSKLSATSLPCVSMCVSVCLLSYDSLAQGEWLSSPGWMIGVLSADDVYVGVYVFASDYDDVDGCGGGCGCGGGGHSFYINSTGYHEMMKALLRPAKA